MVFIAQADFLLECKQTDKQTGATERPTHAGGYTAGVGKYFYPVIRSDIKIRAIHRIHEVYT